MLDSAVFKPLKRIVRPVVREAVGYALRHHWITHATAYGHKVAVPPTHGVIYLSLAMNNYEHREVGLLREHFRKASCIVDIGANLGITSRVAAEEKLTPDGTIICVEPNPETFPFMKRNVEAAQRSAQSMIFHNAALVTSNNGSRHATFFKRPDLNSGLETHRAKNCEQEVIRVPLISMQEILSEVTKPWSLICDAEGAEIGVVENGAGLLDGCEQALIEFHEPEATGLKQTPQEMLAKMQDLGFKMTAQSGNACFFTRDL